jgi:uncharacterized membrane protein
MLRFALTYLGTAATFLALDAVWLTLTVDRLYRPHLGAIMADKPALGPAAVFYVIYIAAIVGLAVLPAVKADSWTQLLSRAALFGLAAYATYDLTNQATLKDWSSVVTLADLAWGTVVTTVAASIGFVIARKMS